MHNIKEIRNNLDLFKSSLKKRFLETDFDEILDLDEKNRKLIQKKENLEKEKKDISKSKDKTLFNKSKDISVEIDKLNKTQLEIKTKLNNILSALPNLPLEDVPLGKDENSNIELSKVGIVPNFDFKARSHYEIGKELNMLDFDLATKTTGSRFVFVKDKLALLERAISNFMLDTQINVNGYTEISPPLIASASSMFGTGQLPKFENDQFELNLDDKNDRKFLIPTAEVILTNMVKDKIFDKNDLPMRLVASTACFRKEAGSYGKDTKGMMRQHQFYKVELVSIVEPEHCLKELDRMTNCATKILDLLKLPYRKIVLCSGDMGFSAEKTIDIEVWIPSENKYREISSCSSCGSFQARRMKARYKNDKNETVFIGSLNGSGLAVGRTLVAILENYQQPDGSIIEVISLHNVDGSTGATLDKCMLRLESDTGQVDLSFSDFGGFSEDNDIDNLITLQPSAATDTPQGKQISWRFTVNTNWEDAPDVRIFATLLASNGIDGLPSALHLAPPGGNAIENDAGISSFDLQNSAGESQDPDEGRSNQLIRLVGSVLLENLQVAPDPSSYSLVVEEEIQNNSVPDEITYDWEELDKDNSMPDKVQNNLFVGSSAELQKLLRNNAQK